MEFVVELIFVVSDAAAAQQWILFKRFTVYFYNMMFECATMAENVVVVSNIADSNERARIENSKNVIWIVQRQINNLSYPIVFPGNDKGVLGERGGVCVHVYNLNCEYEYLKHCQCCCWLYVVLRKLNYYET